MDYSQVALQALLQQRFQTYFQHEQHQATLVEDYRLDLKALPGEGYYRMNSPDTPGMLLLIHEARPLVLVAFMHAHYTAVQVQSTDPALHTDWERLPVNIKRRFWNKLEQFTFEAPRHLRLVKA